MKERISDAEIIRLFQVEKWFIRQITKRYRVGITRCRSVLKGARLIG